MLVNFAAGELDQDTSAGIKAAAHKAIDSGKTQYTDTLGISELRQRLAQRSFAKNRNGLRGGRGGLHRWRETGVVQRQFRAVPAGRRGHHSIAVLGDVARTSPAGRRDTGCAADSP